MVRVFWWRNPTAKYQQFETENSTFNTVLLSNVTSLDVGNTTINSYKENNGNFKNSSSEVYGDQEKNPELTLPSEISISNDSSSLFDTQKQENITLSPGKNGSPFSFENPELILPSKNSTSSDESSLANTWKVDIPLLPGQNGNFTSTLNRAPPAIPNPNPASSSIIPLPNNVSSINGSPPPPSTHVPAEKPRSKMPSKKVLTLSDMNELLIESHLSPESMIPRWSSKADRELEFAQSEIENAPRSNGELYAPLYRNATMFQRSYELMEKLLKVYIYREGDKRIFHKPPLEGIYASEGWFMKLLEANRHFVTKRPEKAPLFYLPFSSRMLEETLYVPNSHSHKNLIQNLKNYLDMISAKYPFWNRTDGADHFLVACHDWAPSETKQHMANCIRALCNADVKEGFKFGKDVSLPETYVRNAQNPIRDVGGRPPSKRRTLAFFAGNIMHGYLRPILQQQWGNNKDPNMAIFGKLPRSKGNRNYIDYMKNSKYCICPRGYEVNSPRVVEAIIYECVPVIISDNFIPPLFEILNWESFAVFVSEKDIPNLKNILLSIPEKTYLRMHMRVKKVQQHFLWHPKPVKYDLFHMILHSICYK